MRTKHRALGRISLCKCKAVKIPVEGKNRKAGDPAEAVMIRKTIAAIILAALAVWMGEETGYQYSCYTLGAITTIMMLRSERTHSFFRAERKDKRNMAREMEGLEISAWLARPAILLLDKYRPSSAPSEIAGIYSVMNTNMPSVVGPERELIRYLHAIASVPMRPTTAIEKHRKSLRSRLRKKWAQRVTDTAISGAINIIVRVNAARRVVDWYVLQAYECLGIQPEETLRLLVYRYEMTAKSNTLLAITTPEYPYEEFDKLTLSQFPTEEMKSSQKIHELLVTVAAWRGRYAQTPPETDEQQYHRVMRPINDAEDQIRDMMMCG